MFRHLRSYRRIAQKQHHCDICQGTIEPGDEYQADVEVQWGNGRKKRISVWKEHVYPSCLPPDFPEDDHQTDENEEDIDLPKAA